MVQSYSHQILVDLGRLQAGLAGGCGGPGTEAGYLLQLGGHRVEHQAERRLLQVGADAGQEGPGLVQPGAAAPAGGGDAGVELVEADDVCAVQEEDVVLVQWVV